MIEQLNTSITFFAFYVANKRGQTGLTVTVDVYNPAYTLIVSGATATAVGGGIYSYTLAAGSVTTEGEYLAIFKTATTTVDQQDIPALWTIGRAGIERLDVALTTRLATAEYTAPNNSGITAIKAKTDLLSFSGTDVVATLDSEPVTVSDKTGYSLAVPPLAASSYVAPDNATISSIASTVSSNLDATISSRLPTSAYTAPANSDITAIRTLVTNTLDAAVSSRLASTAYTAPANADISAIRSAADATFSIVDAMLDVAISTRLATSGYTAPANTDIVAIRTVVDSMLDVAVSTRLAASGYTAPSNADIATIRTEVMDKLDASISSRLAASDYVAPLNADVLIIRDEVLANLDEAVSTRLAATEYVLAPTIEEITAATAATASSVVVSYPSIPGVPPLKTNHIHIRRGDTWIQQITDLGNLSSVSHIWLTSKESANDPDSNAVIQLELSSGLIYLNGVLYNDTGLGTIAVNDAELGNITFYLSPEATRQLIPRTLLFDVQTRVGTKIRTILEGKITVQSDLTHTTV